MNNNDSSIQLQALLDEHQAPYRIIDHQPEGRTDLASAIRGNKLEDAAKAMVLVAKKGKRSSEYILAVVRGDSRLNFDAIRYMANASYVGLASKEKAEELTGCVMGAVPPFTFDPELKLVVDRRLLQREQIVFNACRLDRSIFLPVSSYVAIAKPAVADIAKEPDV
jgi:Ala-tRNA(Pro) deacylase